MVEHARLILRKVYVWRTALLGLLFGFILGIILAAIGLGALWYISQQQGIIPPGITGKDIFLIGVIGAGAFAVLFAIGGIIGTIIYNILAKMGGGLHVDMEEIGAQESSVVVV